MKAYKLLSQGNAAVMEVPIPALRPDGLLVKVACVALNPTDWKHIKVVDVSGPPLTVGCDFSGVVEEVGSSVTQRFQPGDRVWGTVHGSHTLKPDDGAFAEYLVAKADLTLKIPNHMSFSDAASLGVQVYTVGQGLYQSLELPWPTQPVKAEERFPVLIYGGSTVMGSLGIQMAKLSGLEVITTCSPHNFDFVKSLGADKVFDYKSPSVGSDIREYTNNKLRYVWDTIGEGQAGQICADALSSSESPLHYITINPNQFPREDVNTALRLTYTISNEACEVFGTLKLDAQPQDLEFAKRWGAVAAKLFEEKKVVPHPVDVRGRLEDIAGGLRDLEEARVSGKKLVYRIGDL